MLDVVQQAMNRCTLTLELAQLRLPSRSSRPANGSACVVQSTCRSSARPTGSTSSSRSQGGGPMRHAPRAWRQCSSWVLTRVAPGQRRQGGMCTPRLQRKHCTKLPMQLLPSGCSPELALASATRIFWAASQFSSLPAHVFRVVACRCEPRRTASSQSRARKHLSYPLCLPMSSGWWPAIAAAARMGVGWPSTAGRHLDV